MKLNPFRFKGWLFGAAWLTLAVADTMAGDLPLRLVASDPNNPSFFESMSAGFKRGVDNVTSVFKPKSKEPAPADDSISLSKKPRGGADLHVAMGRLYEETDRKAEAAKEYELALKSGAKDPKVLAACAQFKARSSEFDEAIKLYQQALRLAPDDPALLNDMALCFARRQRYPEAISHLTRAIQFQPANALYRNNIAAVLVEIGQPDEALRHLRAAHPEAVAHYNLGFLLNKKGQSVAAAQQFAYALQRDPSLEAAKYWLGRIGAQGGGGLNTPFIGTPAETTAAGQTVLSPAPTAGVSQMPVTAMPPTPAAVMPPASGMSESAPLPPPISTAPSYGYVAPQMQQPPMVGQTPSYGYVAPQVQQPPMVGQAPSYEYVAPQVQQAPVVGQAPSYDTGVRRQEFVEVVPKGAARRLPPPDEPAPLPDERVQRLPRVENRTEPLRRLPPPVVPELD